jgi:hypothetical protein|tara:strand:+ start:511 stop:729 length:219 start_codon:yes stop_codon:yes gene_type:complete
MKEYRPLSMDDVAPSPDDTLLTRLANRGYALVSRLLYPLVIGTVILFILFKVFSSDSSFGAAELIGIMGGEA